MRNIDALITSAYSNAVAHGWWDAPRTELEVEALIHSEVAEALEEIRSGHKLGEIYFIGDKPEGFLVEIADVMIRCCDYLGKIGEVGQSYLDIEAIDYEHIKNPAESLAILHKIIAHVYEDKFKKYCHIIGYCLSLAEGFQLTDALEHAIDVKFKYNVSRPYKHGRVL